MFSLMRPPRRPAIYPEQPATTSERCRSCRPGALLLVGLLASGMAAGMVVARASATAEVTLRLWPAGQGRIEVTQGGTNAPFADGERNVAGR